MDKLKKLDVLDKLASESVEIGDYVQSLQLSLRKNSKNLVNITRKVKRIEKINSALSSKMRFWEKQRRRNNLIFFNITETERDNRSLRAIMLDFFARTMNVNLHSHQVETVHRIGLKNKSSLRPIRVVFASSQSKWDVLHATRNLRGSKIGVMHDLTHEERKTNKQLVSYRKILSRNGVQSSVRGLKMKIKGDMYTLAEVKLLFASSCSTKFTSSSQERSSK